ncbi:MAG: TolC family outer membrane protein [Roseiarcus sp.]
MFFSRGDVRAQGASFSGRTARGVAFAAAVAATLLGAGALRAETIGGALVKAYFNNPDINQQRAAVRASDEELPKASAGYRPTVSAQGDASIQQTDAYLPPLAGGTSLTFSKPRGYGLTVNQTLWNGDRTFNSVRQAESGVMAARETLRNTEQNVLLSGVTAYMNVLRDTAILDLDRNNVEVLQEQLRQTNDRFTVGEVTRTDVAQAEASLAGAQATALSAQSTLQTSIANYRQVIGEEPKNLAPVKQLDKPLPRSLTSAIAISQVEHPAIVGSLYGVDVAALNIKVIEGALYPTVGLTGQVSQQFDVSGQAAPNRVLTASLMGQINIPIYDGGVTYASTRQAKEKLGQQELQTDLQRDTVRAAVVSAWGVNSNSAGIIRSAKAQVAAAEIALAGVREEAKVGQRTTFDVLTAQQTLLSARVQLVSAQHDAVVASYAVMSAIGRLSTTTLGLAAIQYDPKVHFDQVKDKWFGLRTPDGR